MTQEEFDQKIREHNAEFAFLSPQEKRVAIAKDVIRQLNARKLTARSKTWLTGGAGIIRIKEEDYQKPVKEILSTQASCNVCALGSLLVCAAGLANAVTVNDVRDKDSDTYFTVDMFSMTPYLKRFFSMEQLRLIELCFEHGDGGCSPDTAEEWEAAEVFAGDEEDDNGDSIGDGTDDEVRLRLIMECIMRNNGTFVPGDVLR